MKKIASIFLLSIFLFNTMGYFIVFELDQYKIKENIKNEIENGIIPSSISSITITKNKLADIVWTDKNEFRYNDEQFDVLKKSESGNSVTYYCINDRQEGNLFASLDNHINSNVLGDKPLKNNANKTIDLNNNIKLFCSDVYEFKPRIIITTSILSIQIPSDYTNAFLKACFQPPELA